MDSMSFIVILENLMGGAFGFGVARVGDVRVELLSSRGAGLLSLFGVALTSGMVLSVSGSSKCGSPLACRFDVRSGLDMFVFCFVCYSRYCHLIIVYYFPVW